ncbi:MAG TPA: fatty acid desaturase [Myxococcales bacterium]|nr:fatty acid desaturase [Myxococcales bacterium]
MLDASTESKLLNDPRDRPFLVLMAACTLVVLPFAGALYVPGVFRWWLGVAYLAVVGLVFLDRFILMLHNTSHRPLFKKRWRLLNLYIPWVLGPFFGETPETYFAHHIGMHHPENNLDDDLSSTMPYQRDRALDFLLYFGRFMAFGVPELSRYFERTNRPKLRNRMLVGELSFYAAVAALLVLNWRATLTVFVIPFFLVRFLMMAGNWGQHAFIDGRTPEVAFRNSITVLAKRYNRRCFNDGYHIGHHLNATRHWSEMPGDFETNRADYAREGALVFDIDFFAVWFLLMLKRYRTLAAHLMTLEGERPSEADLVALLRERTRALGPTRSAMANAA